MYPKQFSDEEIDQEENRVESQSRANVYSNVFYEEEVITMAVIMPGYTLTVEDDDGQRQTFWSGRSQARIYTGLQVRARLFWVFLDPTNNDSDITDCQAIFTTQTGKSFVCDAVEALIVSKVVAAQPAPAPTSVAVP